MSYRVIQNDELYHHGIKGQKWGVRRFQNPDGTLTPEGRVHYQRQERTEKGRQTRRTIGSVASGGVSAGTAAAGFLAAVKYDNLSVSLVAAGKKALELGGTAALQQHMSTLVTVATVSPYVAAGAAAVSVALGVGAALAKHKKNKARDTLASDDALSKDTRARNINRMDNYYKTIKDDMQKDAIKEGYLPKQKSEKMRLAKQDHVYDDLFMEVVQSGSIGNDREGINKEYSLYLDNPEQYYINRKR